MVLQFIYLLKEQAFSFVDFFYGLFCFFWIYFCPNFYNIFLSTCPGILHFFLFVVALDLELGDFFFFLTYFLFLEVSLYCYETSA